jgi:hypothetical protein
MGSEEVVVVLLRSAGGPKPVFHPSIHSSAHPISPGQTATTIKIDREIRMTWISFTISAIVTRHIYDYSRANHNPQN